MENENKAYFNLYSVICTHQESISMYGFHKGNSYKAFTIFQLNGDVLYCVLNDDKMIQTFNYDEFTDCFLPDEYDINIDANTLVVSCVKRQNENQIIENAYR